ncbi:type VI secretion system protein ImpH [Pseudoduganella flava]|uniref:Type VI secretion system baseplate subunit TssG n=1 Tax=Pseudoduganella flava TaxID=871742 RepID=A0A562PJX3_9BURK|nr:type VI secretion system baseplate subunit TssG [Pseudoduganella flava]QGZ42215.1 type VI secretion system baseplate subunit TssG [Pseudoduganella flava]TWI44751.1 type VI secretion system protein ImpH [Pseudoduganella flava]
MQAPAWRHPTGLIRALFDRPHSFAFFQAVRLLDAWLRPSPLEHALRFRNSVSLGFPAGQIETLVSDGTRIHLTPAFIGFLGIKGALPYFYTEAIAAQVHGERSDASRAFLDCFSQRSVLLFYRAWEKCHVEYRLGKDGRAALLTMQLCLAGLPRHAGTAALPVEVAAHHAPSIGQQPVCAELLTAILREHFRVPIRLEPFVDVWETLAPSELSVLGERNCRLGDVVLGSRYRTRSSCVRLWLGPLSRIELDHFLPEAPGGEALAAMLALFAVPALRYEIRLILRAQDVKPIVLDRSWRLGYASFLVTSRSANDRHETRYLIELL